MTTSRTWLSSTSTASLKPRQSAMVAFDGDVGVGMGVAGEKPADLQRPRRERGAEDDDVAEAALEERHAAKDERAHEDLAELRVGLHETEKLVTFELDDLAGGRRTKRDQAAAAGQQIQLAAELTRPMGGDELLAVAAGAHDFELTVGDDDERKVQLAFLDQDVAAPECASPPLDGDPGDLRVRQYGERLLLGHGGIVPLALENWISASDSSSQRRDVQCPISSTATLPPHPPRRAKQSISTSAGSKETAPVRFRSRSEK